MDRTNHGRLRPVREPSLATSTTILIPFQPQLQCASKAPPPNIATTPPFPTQTPFASMTSSPTIPSEIQPIAPLWPQLPYASKVPSPKIPPIILVVRNFWSTRLGEQRDRWMTCLTEIGLVHPYSSTSITKGAQRKERKEVNLNLIPYIKGAWFPGIAKIRETLSLPGRS